MVCFLSILGLALVGILLFVWIPDNFLLYYPIAAVIYAGAVSAFYMKKKIAYDNRLLELSRVAATRMMEKLINGDVPPEDNVIKVLGDTKNGKSSEYFAVIHNSVFDVTELFPEYTGSRIPVEAFEYIDLHLRAIFSSNIDKKHISYFIPQKGGMVIVVNLFGLDEDNLDNSGRKTIGQLCEVVAQCLQEVYKEISIVMGAVVSTVYYGKDGIYAAYREAVDLSEYAELMGDKQTVKNAYSFERSSEDLSTKKNLMDLERQYHNCLTTKDYTKAAQVVDSIIVAESLLAFGAPHELKSRLVIRLEQLLNVLGISVADYDSSEFEVVQAFKANIEVGTIDELRAQTGRFFQAVDNFTKQITIKNSDKVDRVLSFINEHYADPNISATMISDSLGISASYLSHILKQSTGMGIVDCIHMNRHSHIKQLLMETDLSVDDIAERVGFSNRWTLTRSFKRYEGITPGVFREGKFNK